MEAADQVISVPVVTESSARSARWRRAGVVCLAGALAACVVLVSSQDLPQAVELSRKLKLAMLPHYSPASEALDKKDQKDVNAVSGILQREKARQDTNKDGSDAKAGNTALSKKELHKIIAAARAAAEKNNALIHDADDQLRASQKALGDDAADVPLLTDSPSARKDSIYQDNSGLSALDLQKEVSNAKQDKGAAKALEAATEAAARNKKLMQQAGNILKDSEKMLGRDAIQLPSLGHPPPLDMYKKIVDDGDKQSTNINGAKMRSRTDELADRKFLKATALARMDIGFNSDLGP